MSYSILPTEYLWSIYSFVVVLRFAACDKRICVTVPIVDDEIVENTESFKVTLERPTDLDGSITLGPVDGVVEMTDNDGRYEDYVVVTDVTRGVTICSNICGI